MVCHTLSAQVGAIEAVIKAVRSGEISQEAIEASANRVHALKAKYLQSFNTLPNSFLENLSTQSTRQDNLAFEIYSKSTTVVRSDPKYFPLETTTKKICFLGPGKTAIPGGAVESGQEKTREPHTPSSYIDLLQTRNPNIIDIPYHDGIALPPESEQSITEADAVILATRNANLSPYQKNMGLSLGKRLGKKLIVVATCDPYDFLEETEVIKNYLTIYEPTLSAFRSAIDIIFGLSQPCGTLPVCSPPTKHEIQNFKGSSEEIETIWHLWKEIFPEWYIDLERLNKILRNGEGHHLIHDKGFCLAWLFEGIGNIACVGVLPSHRGKGIGTALVRKVQQGLRATQRLELMGIVSIFPRFWPGVPLSIPQKDRDFFLHRGN